MSTSSAGAPGAVDQLVGAFAAYLRRERGVSELTVAVYVSDVRKLLLERGDSDLRDLTAAEVSNAVLGQVGAWAPASVRHFGCSCDPSFATAMSQA